MFQRGIVIIDSPGVGESDIMDEIVTEYLPRAFAFIYTINSSNAGGVQKDRVSDNLVKLKVIYTIIVTICLLYIHHRWNCCNSNDKEICSQTLISAVHLIISSMSCGDKFSLLNAEQGLMGWFQDTWGYYQLPKSSHQFPSTVTTGYEHTKFNICNCFSQHFFKYQKHWHKQLPQTIFSFLFGKKRKKRKYKRASTFFI